MAHTYAIDNSSAIEHTVSVTFKQAIAANYSITIVAQASGVFGTSLNLSLQLPVLQSFKREYQSTVNLKLGSVDDDV